MYAMGATPRSMRSWLTTMKSCSGTGRARTARFAQRHRAHSFGRTGRVDGGQPVATARGDVGGGVARGKDARRTGGGGQGARGDDAERGGGDHGGGAEATGGGGALLGLVLFCCGVVFMSSIVGVTTSQLMMRRLSWAWCKWSFRLVHLHQWTGSISARGDAKWLPGSWPMRRITIVWLEWAEGGNLVPNPRRIISVETDATAIA